MYRIIGADGKEYGPISVEQVRQWIAEGRADARTLAQAEASSEWKPLGSFPDFSTLPSPAPPVASAEATGLVRVPAILLILTGALGMLVAVVGILQNFSGATLPQLESLPPEIPPWAMRVIHYSMSVPANLINCALSTVILLGGISMLKIKNWKLALASAILAILCGNPCCCPIGLVAGIWSLVVLTKSEVKSAFK